MVGRKRKVTAPVEEPVDLLRRIGGKEAAPPYPPEPSFELPQVGRHDGLIDSAARPPAAGPVPNADAKSGRPTLIGLDEAPLAPEATAPARHRDHGTEPPHDDRPGRIRSGAAAPGDPRGRAGVRAALLSVREAPEFGEIDLLATPLPTPDDWHHFELALRKLRGIGGLRTEYYRAGVLKVRVRWSGADRFANAIRAVPGYHVRVLGEDRNTVQVLVGRR